MRTTYCVISMALILGLTLGCEKGQVDILNPDPQPKDPKEKEFTPWTIQKDFHNCTCSGFREIDLSETLTFEFYFDASAYYNSKDLNDPKSWNKVIGFSDCSTHHHDNSLRLGWRVDPEDGIELGMYYYQNKERKMDHIMFVSQEDTLQVKMYVEGSTYNIKINEVLYTAEGRHCSNEPIAYMLYPYFGGTDKAPHDITIWFRFPD